MADAVRVDTLVNGPRNVVLHCTNVSDGTGEAAVVKADASALGATLPKLMRVKGTTAGMSVNLFWDATTDDLICTLPADTDFDLDFRKFGGLQNPNSTGATGDIVATTVGHTNGDTYAFTLELKKT